MVWFVSRVAYACSCGDGVSDVFPNPGDVVAVDTRLLFAADRFDGDVVLRDPLGAEIGLTWEDSTQDEVTWRVLTPEQPLQPETDYTIDYTGEHYLASLPRTFRTLPAVDRKPPAEVSLTVEGRGADNPDSGGDCGVQQYIWLAISGGSDDGAAWYETEIASNPQFDGARRRTHIVAQTSIGETGCWVTLSDVPEPAWVRSRAVDATGAPGPWSASQRATFGVVGAACSHSDPVAGVWAVLVALGLMRRARRG